MSASVNQQILFSQSHACACSMVAPTFVLVIEIKHYLDLTNVLHLWLTISKYGWLCLTSHRQRGHLETAPPFTVPCEGREAR